MQWTLKVYHLELPVAAAGHHRKKKNKTEARFLLSPAQTAHWPLHKTCGANLMTNTDERVRYGFYYSDAVRARALSLHLIELDGKLIKVLLVFTAESAKQGS